MVHRRALALRAAAAMCRSAAVAPLAAPTARRRELVGRSGLGMSGLALRPLCCGGPSAMAALPALRARGLSTAVEDDVASVPESLAAVRARVDAAVAQRPAAAGSGPVRLVAVSKTKPAAAVAAAYATGHRHFGENYVQEILTKCTELPSDVQWHFIGHLQSNKARALTKGVPSLACVETVDSAKLARLLNAGAAEAERAVRLRVMVQVNTSGEASKAGVAPSDCVAVCRAVAEECPALELAGLMTIGAPDYSGCRTEDFECLRRCRSEVAEALGVEIAALELSMGMSGDFERAILEGSTSVRVGSSIFGARSYPAKA